MHTRARRFRAAALMVLQLLLGIRGFLWAEPATIRTGATATRSAFHSAGHATSPHARDAHSAQHVAPPVDHDDHETRTDAPCPQDAACHAGPPCCVVVATPAAAERIRSAIALVRATDVETAWAARRDSLRVDHALPLATAPPTLV